jgi:hypothetical protein
LTSFGLSLLNRVYSINSFKTISNFLEALNFNPVIAQSHTGATPKNPTAPVTKNISPTYSPEKYMAGISVGWRYWSSWKKGGSLQPAAPAN